MVLLLLAGVHGLKAQDIIKPATPEIIRVSVDTATGLANITWKPSLSPNVVKYVLYYYTPGIDGAIAIDTVDGETRVYTYTNVTPSLSEQKLTVTAVNSEGTVSLLPEPPHRTMHLSTEYDSCEKSMKLIWTPYQGWGDKTVRNEVYYSVDGGSFNLLSEIHPDSITYLHLNIPDNKRYCYFIKSIHPETWSFSNIACREVSHPIQPAWINAESASVVGDNQVEVKFVMDPAGEVTSFQLYKSPGPGKPFSSDVSFSDVYDSLVHRDEVLTVDKKYQYKLYSLDVCGNPVTESNICGNIVLSVFSKGLEAFLSWSPYGQYEAGVKDYLIYRDINRSGSPEIVGGVHYPDTTYTDDLAFLSAQQTEDEICYIIEAEENETWQRGNQGYSRSNMACVTVVPEIVIANAIIPNASMQENREIKPALTFIPRQYLFQVFDRWGNRIFETTDSETPWEGRVNGGNYVPEGAYAYYIKLTTSNGIEVEKKGLITVFYK